MIVRKDEPTVEHKRSEASGIVDTKRAHRKKARQPCSVPGFRRPLARQF